MCQNISTEVFLATSKNQANVLSDDYVVGIRQFFNAKEIVFHPPSREEELKNTEHSMSMAVDTKASNFRNQQCRRVHVWFIVTIYYKTRQLFFYKIYQVFYYKIRQLLQNVSILFPDGTVITKCDVYCKMRRYIKYIQWLYMNSHIVGTNENLLSFPNYTVRVLCLC